MQLVKRKAKKIRQSGRSSDFITPSFGYGCEYKCNYCYMRRHVKTGLTIASNTQELITTINNHVNSLKWPKIPNQTHNKYYTYDFSCNEDYIKHLRHHKYKDLFYYFATNDKAFGTAATKYVNRTLLKWNPDRKVRIRFSLMPQKLSDKLEPGTSKIIDRIQAINEFYSAGYDVHINYSPIIVYKDWLNDYKELFKIINNEVIFKEHVLAECIFLTHNEEMHKHNILKKTKGEQLLWVPQLQESKISQYGGANIRYNHVYKKVFIEQFKALHSEYIPWNTIRYIF